VEEAHEILTILLSRFDLDADKDRAVLAKQAGQLTLPFIELRDLAGAHVARRLRESGKADLPDLGIGTEPFVSYVPFSNRQ